MICDDGELNRVPDLLMPPAGAGSGVRISISEHGRQMIVALRFARIRSRLLCDSISWSIKPDLDMKRWVLPAQYHPDSTGRVY